MDKKQHQDQEECQELLQIKKLFSQNFYASKDEQLKLQELPG
jgi:hypothetical protein